MRLKGSCHCRAVRFSVDSHTPYPFMRCYCSICRKTAGGGGYAINIMGDADTLEVEGEDHVRIYQAIIHDTGKRSEGKRHFCGDCGSALFITAPGWPELVHPFASAIDTPLPHPPESVHIMLDFKAPWVEVPESGRDTHFGEYPDESIEGWHRSRDLYLDDE